MPKFLDTPLQVVYHLLFIFIIVNHRFNFQVEKAEQLSALHILSYGVATKNKLAML